MTDPNPQEVRPPIKPEQARAADEEVVTMVFPRPVRLTTNDGRVIDFPAGIQEVPESLADHQYLKLSGAKAHDKSSSGWRKKLGAKSPASRAQLTQHHLDFMRSQGVDVTDLAAAQAMYDSMTPEDKDDFIEESLGFQSNSQYELQRRVQDHASGAKDPAPTTQEGDVVGGPKPAGVNTLIREGAVTGAGQVGSGIEVAHTPTQNVKLTEAHREFFKSRSYNDSSLEESQKRFDNMSANDKQKFLQDFQKNYKPAPQQPQRTQEQRPTKPPERK